MSGKYKYDLVLKGMTGLIGCVIYGVWAARNIKSIVSELSDSQPDEVLGAITLVATQELPKLWDAFNAPAENPLA